MKPFILSAYFGLTFLAAVCSPEDDFYYATEDLSIVEEHQLSHIDDGDVKQWKLTGFYKSIQEGILDVDYTTCMQDDLYTFFDGNPEGETIFGLNSCFVGYTAAHTEHSSIAYDYKPAEKRLYLVFGRGAQSTVLNRSTSWSTIYKCVELNEDRMVFAQGTDGSGEGLIFERISNNSSR